MYFKYDYEDNWITDPFVKKMIKDVDTAIKQLDQLLQDSSVEKEKDTLYYLRGNAYRKKGDWKQALDNYQYAIEINPDSPAVQARKMAIDILNFYHKDMFNQ